MFSLYIDADSLPKQHREIVLRRVMKDHIESYFVADRSLPDVLDVIKEDTRTLRDPYRGVLDKDDLKKIKSNIHMVVVETGANSADDYIVEIIKTPSLAITHDIPLAARLLDKGAFVIDDRGREFNKDNIKQLLSLRDLNTSFRETGIFFDKSARFDSKTLNQFANCFDSIIAKLVRETCWKFKKSTFV